MRRWLPRSIRGQFALLAALLVGVIYLILATALYTSSRQASEDYRTGQAVAAAERVSFFVEQGLFRRDLPPYLESMLQVVDERGTVVSATVEISGRPAMSAVRPTGQEGPSIVHTCSSPAFPGECMIIVALPAEREGRRWTVYSAVPAVPFYVHPVFMSITIAGGVLLVAATALGAYRTVRKTLEPVDHIRAELAEITASDLKRRVPVPEGEEELRNLAQTVNATLDRLEAIVEQQRRFASDASHDLRSPITAMRAQIEESLLAPEEADWAGTLAGVLANLDRLQAIVTDLLTLAKLESGAPGAREPVDLAALVSAEVERRQPRVQIVTDLQPGVVVTGDPQRLGRLLTNLLDNAERHAESRIVVLVRRVDNRAKLEVIDDGAGIPRDKWEEVFQRFTRLDASRNRDAGGTGLGLPIAREIAERHGGTLTIEESMRGARFVLRIPLPGSGTMRPSEPAG